MNFNILNNKNDIDTIDDKGKMMKTTNNLRDSSQSVSSRKNNIESIYKEEIEKDYQIRKHNSDVKQFKYVSKLSVPKVDKYKW